MSRKTESSYLSRIKRIQRWKIDRLFFLSSLLKAISLELKVTLVPYQLKTLN